MFNFLKRNKIDICLLQETHVTAECVQMWNQEWGSKIYYSAYDSAARGVCILLGKNFPGKVMDHYHDNQGRFSGIKIEVEDKLIAVGNVYAPNSDNPDYFVEVINYMQAMNDADITILGGDFNLVMNPKLDRLSTETNHKDSHAILLQFMENTELCDIWRVQHPEERLFSWCRQGKFGNQASRIDMILLSQSHADLITESSISYGHHTDHSLITSVLRLDNFERGPGVWKFNNEFLNEENFCEGMQSNIIEAIKQAPLLNPDEAWEVLKKECISFSKQWGKACKKERNEEMELLINTKSSLQADLYSNPGNEEALSSLRQVKQQINKIERIKTESSIFRSKAKWAMDREVSSSFFFALEKKRYMSKNMKCVITDKGEILNDPKQILDEQTRFFYRLYSRNKNVNFNLTREDNEPCLTEAQRLELDSPLLIDEIYDAIMTLKNSKCPGLDGLTVEFYRKFYSHLKIRLFKMYWYSYFNGYLPLTTRRGVISLLPKGQKDPRYVKFRRGLTLLDYDYKILAKALDNRLCTVIESVVGEEQQGFISGRSIACNL